MLRCKISYIYIYIYYIINQTFKNRIIEFSIKNYRIKNHIKILDGEKQTPRGEQAVSPMEDRIYVWERKRERDVCMKKEIVEENKKRETE